MREAQYTAKLRTTLKPEVYALKLNLAFTAGVPDVWYSGTKRDLWSEHKRLVNLPPVLKLYEHKYLTKLQQKWLKDRQAEGRNTCVVVFTQDWGHVLFQGLSWDRPIPKREFIMRSRNMVQLADDIKRVLNE